MRPLTEGEPPGEALPLRRAKPAETLGAVRADHANAAESTCHFRWRLPGGRLCAAAALPDAAAAKRRSAIDCWFRHLTCSGPPPEPP